MEHYMYAKFSDKAYSDLMHGEAMFNNGFRTNKGTFHPEQPIFGTIPTKANSQLKNTVNTAVVNMSIYAFSVCIFEFAIPFAKEKVYPYLSKKFDLWQEKQFNPAPNQTGSYDNSGSSICTESSNVIKFDKYKHRA